MWQRAQVCCKWRCLYHWSELSLSAWNNLIWYTVISSQEFWLLAWFSFEFPLKVNFPASNDNRTRKMPRSEYDMKFWLLFYCHLWITIYSLLHLSLSLFSLAVSYLQSFKILLQKHVRSISSSLELFSAECMYMHRTTEFFCSDLWICWDMWNVELLISSVYCSSPWFTWAIC